MTAAPSRPAASPGARPDTVYFFATCLVDMFFPEAGLAGMELLRRAGLRVVFPQGQSCCGQPSRNSGFGDEARRVARAQLDAFPQDWPIVVPSGSCAGMMRTHYPDLFAGDADHARACAFAGRVVELSWFLVHVLDLPATLVDRGRPLTVTWHGSCHSRREMGIDAEPKQLLAALANVTVVPVEREAECCGFGGTFAVRQPEVSAAMVADKVADVVATGAKRVISGDCGCLMNVGGALEKGGHGVRAQHLAEFLLERLDHDRA